MRQRAVDKVDLWMFKAGQLPPAIVATASLTEAVLHDEARRGSSGTVVSESALQSIYAMAFARFVNGFVDRDVARSRTAEMVKEDSTAESEEETATSLTTANKGESSMYAHAATIGMPQKFVDLRHQVTHGDIPNVTYLRKMTEQALEWLWERWWTKHATGSSELAVRELEDRQRISREAREARESEKDSSAQPSDVFLPGTLSTEMVRKEQLARVGNDRLIP
jgi:ribosomal biogenesis protein LAS1